MARPKKAKVEKPHPADWRKITVKYEKWVPPKKVKSPETAEKKKWRLFANTVAASDRIAKETPAQKEARLVRNRAKAKARYVPHPRPTPHTLARSSTRKLAHGSVFVVNDPRGHSTVVRSPEYLM